MKGKKDLEIQEGLCLYPLPMKLHLFYLKSLGSATILPQPLSLVNSQFSKSAFLFHWASQLYLFTRAAITKYLKLGALNKRKMLSCSSRGQKSKIKMSTLLVPSEGGPSVPRLSPSFWQSQVLLGLQMVSSLCLHIIFPPCMSLSLHMAFIF